MTRLLGSEDAFEVTHSLFVFSKLISINPAFSAQIIAEAPSVEATLSAIITSGGDYGDQQVSDRIVFTASSLRDRLAQSQAVQAAVAVGAFAERRVRANQEQDLDPNPKRLCPDRP